MIQVRRSFAPAFAAGVAARFVSVLPAAGAPPNDARQDARTLGRLPASVAGTTRGVEPDDDDRASPCGRVAGAVWYRLVAARRGPVVIRLRASSALDAIVSVYRRARTRLHNVACRGANAKGAALLAFYGRRDAEYLVEVGRRPGSGDDDFRLQVFRPERRALPPGRPLDAGVTQSTVHALQDVDDAWSYTMERGRSYRINLLPSRSCVSAAIYRPRTYRFAADEPVAKLDCGGYTVFTPGPDGGGRYSVRVESDGSVRGPQPYRLQLAPAEADDVAPGVALGLVASVEGSLSGRGIDLVDLYRFSAGQLSELDVRLRTRPRAVFAIHVLRPTGEAVSIVPRVRAGTTVLRRRLDAGHYFLVVRSEERSGGPYSLGVTVRGVTTTDLLVAGRRYVEATPETAQVLSATVSPTPSAGSVRFQLDRRDPLFGWQFVQLVDVPVASNGLATLSWLPPTVGHWRVRARFLGTQTAASSVSGYTRIFVADSLEGRGR